MKTHRDPTEGNPQPAQHLDVATGPTGLDYKIKTLDPGAAVFWDQAMADRRSSSDAAGYGGDRVAGLYRVMAADAERRALKLEHLDDDYAFADSGDCESCEAKDSCASSTAAKPAPSYLHEDVMGL